MNIPFFFFVKNKYRILIKFLFLCNYRDWFVVTFIETFVSLYSILEQVPDLSEYNFISIFKVRKMSKKLVICCTKIDNEYNLTSLVNRLCSIDYKSLDLEQSTIGKSKSPLRIIETTINKKQLELWHLTEIVSSNLPLICARDLDALIVVANENVLDFLNLNSALFIKNSNLPILWLSRQQIDPTILNGINLQSNYNIRQIYITNSSQEYVALESIEKEFNNWFRQI